MTVLRMLAHRAGWIDQMVPQAVEVWAREKTLGPARTDLAVHHIADQLLHLGYGLSWGVLYGATVGRHGASPLRTLGFAAVQWSFGSLILLPGLGVLRPEWKAKPREIALNATAHVLYAAVVGLVAHEMDRQRADQPRLYPRSAVATTG